MASKNSKRKVLNKMSKLKHNAECLKCFFKQKTGGKQNKFLDVY
jgi:hypothetical protein